MTFVDANYFLRFFTQPVTPRDAMMSQTAHQFFGLVRAGSESFTTTDAVIAEVVFALQRYYGLARADVTDRLQALLSLSGCLLTTKQQVLLALDLWESTPKVGWVDALLVVHARESGSSLATFDSDVIRLPDLSIWQPPVSNNEAN